MLEPFVIHFDFVQPRSTLFCDEDDKVIMEIRMADTKRLGVAGFMTEWQVTIIILLKKTILKTVLSFVGAYYSVFIVSLLPGI